MPPAPLPLFSLTPFVAAFTLSAVVLACLPTLSKVAIRPVAFLAALSAKSEMPSNPLFIKSKPALAYLPTLGSLERISRNARKGPVTTFITASNTCPSIGIIEAKALIATLATEITILRNVSLLLNNLTIPATNKPIATTTRPIGFAFIAILKALVAIVAALVTNKYVP